MKALLLPVAIVLAIIGITDVADAKGRRAGSAPSACFAEIKKFCGEGAVDILRGKCLTSRKADLSSGCRAAVEAEAKT